MAAKIVLKLEPTEVKAIEAVLNLAHSGEKEQAILILSLMALFGGWHKDDLFYYFKEGGIEWN